MEVDISQTKYDLAEAKTKLANVQRKVPYNVQEEIKLHLEVEALEQGLEFAEKVLKERF